MTRICFYTCGGIAACAVCWFGYHGLTRGPRGSDSSYIANISKASQGLDSVSGSLTGPSSGSSGGVSLASTGASGASSSSEGG